MDNEMIYMDYAATAPLRDSVRQRVTDSLDVFGNPSSLHRIGMTAEELLTNARKSLLRALGTPRGRLIFTGGGTEANNLAILGSAQVLANRGRHIVTTAIEHPAVLEPLRMLERHGWTVTYVYPNAFGDIEVEDIIKEITDQTVLVSSMHVNNETGAILPVEQLGKALKPYPKLRFHVDGTQALGKIPFHLGDWPIDLYTVSAHKVGGLKGVGALYAREGISLSPVILGGGQEGGFRSGTENVLGAMAFGQAALEAATFVDATDMDKAGQIRSEFVAALSAIPGWSVREPKCVSPYIVSASLEGLRGEVVVHAFEQKGLYVSSGSACSTAGGAGKRSHVLTAMGLSDAEADASVRFSWSPETSPEELQRALAIVRTQSDWLRSMVGP